MGPQLPLCKTGTTILHSPPGVGGRCSECWGTSVPSPMTPQGVALPLLSSPLPRLLGVDKVLGYALNEWLQDIRKNQLPGLLGGVGPMHSVVQLCEWLGVGALETPLTASGVGGGGPRLELVQAAQPCASLTTPSLQSKGSGTCSGCPSSSTGRTGASCGACSGGLPPLAPPRPPPPWNSATGWCRPSR